MSKGPEAPEDKSRLPVRHGTLDQSQGQGHVAMTVREHVGGRLWKFILPCSVLHSRKIFNQGDGIFM